MRLAVTLVAAGYAPLAAGLEIALEAVVGEGLPIAETRQLGDGSMDLVLDGGDPGRLRPRLERALERHPIDVCVQPAEGRRKRLLVADMDSTIITVECLDELADMAGLKDRIAAITARAMAGEIDFEPALIERVGLLAGLPLGAIGRVHAERVRLTAGAETLVRTMAASGARCVLVSGGFTAFTEAVARAAGFQAHRANRLIADGAALTGAGANDLPMSEAAGLGGAFHAKPTGAEAADARVEHGDLTTLLYFQGYSADMFA